MSREQQWSDFVDERPSERETEYQTEQTRDAGWLRLVAMYMVLGLVGSVSAFFWYHAGAAITPASLTAKVDAVNPTLMLRFEDLQKAGRDIAAGVQRNLELLQIQQAEISRLSGEVSQISTKLDLLQKSPREAQQAPSPPPKRTAPKRPSANSPAREPQSPAPLPLTREEGR